MESEECRGILRHIVGSIASDTSDRAIERERERGEDDVTLSTYTAIQKGTVCVKDAVLWKGPHMAALKLAAVTAAEAIKANRKKKLNKASSDVSGEEVKEELDGGRRRCCHA